MKDIVEMMAKALVDNPDQVKVTEVTGPHTTIITLRVAQPDRGKVIGRHGETVRCIQTLLNSIAMKHGKRCVLDIPG